MVTTIQGSLLLFATHVTAHVAYKAYKLQTASWDPNDESFERRVRWNKIKSWFKGTKALTLEQEKRGHKLLGEYNSQESGSTAEVTDDDLFDVELDGGGKVTRKRINRRMHKPFVHRLVRHCRGELGQRAYMPSNVLIVERTARAYCHEHFVRSSDISCILPVVVVLYFYSRSELQIEAHAIEQSMAFVKSTEPRPFEGVSGTQRPSAGC